MLSARLCGNLGAQKFNFNFPLRIDYCDERSDYSSGDFSGPESGIYIINISIKGLIFLYLMV